MLSSKEIDQVASKLSKLEPGFLPFAIFHQIARLVTMAIVEIVPLRKSPEGKIEILLLKREADDPIFPRQLHSPGKVVLASDTAGSFNSTLQRVLSEELTGVRTSKPVFVKSMLHHSGRGMEVSQIFWVEVYGDSTVGEFYNVNNLPATIMQSQLDFIPAAIAHFAKGTNDWIIPYHLL